MTTRTVKTLAAAFALVAGLATIGSLNATAPAQAQYYGDYPPPSYWRPPPPPRWGPPPPPRYGYGYYGQRPGYGYYAPQRNCRTQTVWRYDYYGRPFRQTVSRCY